MSYWVGPINWVLTWLKCPRLAIRNNLKSKDLNQVNFCARHPPVPNQDQCSEALKCLATDCQFESKDGIWFRNTTIYYSGQEAAKPHIISWNFVPRKENGEPRSRNSKTRRYYWTSQRRHAEHYSHYEKREILTSVPEDQCKRLFALWCWPVCSPPGKLWKQRDVDHDQRANPQETLGYKTSSCSK